MNIAKVGVNGFGRIGRLVVKAAIESGKVTIVAINEPFMDLSYMVYLFKYDTVHGGWKGTIEAKDDYLIINENRIRVFKEKEPFNIKWYDVGAEYICESSGIFTNKEGASKHLLGGARKVIYQRLQRMMFLCMLWV
jgi:glyceraldehyde 3-phosphate dehydrogenase